MLPVLSAISLWRMPPGRRAGARRLAAGRGHGRARFQGARRRRRRRRFLRILGEQRGVDGRGIELSREGVNECVAKGLAVIQGDADTDLVDYPDDAFDYVILSQTLQATRRRASCSRTCCASAGGHRLVSRISATGISAQLRLRRPYAGHRQPALFLVRLAQHPFLHDQGLRGAVRVAGAKIERAVAFDAWGTPLRLMRRGGSGTCSASRRCSC